MKLTFSDYLKQQLANLDDIYNPEYSFVLRITDFYNLLCAILDEDISPSERHMVNAALAYLVSPVDVIPEDIYGARGYVDDIYVLSSVVKYLCQDHLTLVKGLWSGGDMDETLNLCYSNSRGFLEKWNLKDKVLKYSGLSDLGVE
jgi:uncharacterized membrane protein YkvA (DUF1232 family)